MRGGFTLIELLIVLAILGALTFVVVPAMSISGSVQVSLAAKDTLRLMRYAHNMALQTQQPITLTFAPEIPVFGLESIDDAGDRRIFQFESGGCISAESSTAFFDFAPVPQNARAAVREGNPAADGRDGGSAGTDGLLEPLVTVAPNFFLAGENASIVTGRGQTGGKSARPFFATLAKFFLLSEDVSVVPFPSSFSMEKHGNVFQLDQILWLREENEAVCKRMLVLPDFAAGEYRFAVISGFPQVFAGKQEELNRLALSLLEESVPEAEN